MKSTKERLAEKHWTTR